VKAKEAGGMREVPDVCSELYGFCRDDPIVAAFLSKVITEELTDPDEDLYFHNKIYAEALENAMKDEKS